MLNIAYYAHSHGSGHCNYAQYFAGRRLEHTWVYTSREHRFSDDVDATLLPSEDRTPADFPPELESTPRYLHYSPVGNRNITQRCRRLLQDIIAHRIDLVIVDLSVEVAALCRAASVPYAYVRLMGDRSDLPHEEAFRGAVFLLAYYPASLEDPATPTWVVEKTVYLGYVCKTPLHLPEYPDFLRALNLSYDDLLLTVIKGFGGCGEVEAALPSIRRQFFDHKILHVGPREEASPYADLDIGQVPSVHPYLAYSKVVVIACGSNLVAEAMAYTTPVLTIAADRHFQEQVYLARNLERCGLAFRYAENIRSRLNNIPPRIAYGEQDSYWSDFIKLCNQSTSVLQLRENLLKTNYYGRSLNYIDTVRRDFIDHHL